MSAFDDYVPPPARCTCPPRPCPQCQAAGERVPRHKAGRHPVDHAAQRAVHRALLAADDACFRDVCAQRAQGSTPALEEAYRAVLRRRQYHRRRLRALDKATTPFEEEAPHDGTT
jgi:hypothetical protein